MISAIRENKIVAFTKEMHIYLTDEQVGSLMDMLTNIKTAKILPAAVRKFITDEMTPYLNGSKTFDECYSRLETTLELYKDE